MNTTQPTRPEADRICNLVPSRDTERDWTIEHALAAGAITAPLALPASVDLRVNWWNVGDQGLTGSCVGWAAADGVARYHMVKAGKIQVPGKLSPRFVWMASKETDEIDTRPSTFIEQAGTTLKDALDVLRKYGAAPEELLPLEIKTHMYIDLDHPESFEEIFYATAARYKILQYYNLGKNLTSWRTGLATCGPILAGLRVDATWLRATETQGKLDAFQPKTVRGGHAVCIVGYTPDNRFIIRNSWGDKWGDKGFAFASEAYIQDAFFDESYKVIV